MITENIAIYASAHDEAAEKEARLRGQIRAAWRAHSPARNSTAAQHAAMALLLGIPLDKAFSPITNAAKLSNGANPNQGRDTAVAVALSGNGNAWAPFASLLEGATSKERWGGLIYDMASHPLLARAINAGKQS